MKFVFATTVLNLVLVHGNQDNKSATCSAWGQNMVSFFQKRYIT